MLKLFVSAAAAVMMFAAVAPAEAAVSFEAAKAVSNASAHTNYGQDGYGDGFGTKSKTASSFTSLVSATAGANAVSYAEDGVTTDTANALETSKGLFISSAKGTFDLAGITSATTYGPSQTAEAYSEGQSLQYTFTVDTGSVISLSYALNESFTGCCSSAQLYLGAADFSSSFFNDQLALNSAGSLSFNLNPGTYLLSLYSQIGDYASTTDGASAFGSHEEKLDFAISAAPEPGVWALMIIGMGLMGLVIRRRSAGSAQPA